MTTTVLLLNLGILAFVLKTGLGTRELNRRRFTLPLAIVAVGGARYMRSVPTSTGAIELITSPRDHRCDSRLVAAALMNVRRTDDTSWARRRGVAVHHHAY